MGMSARTDFGPGQVEHSYEEFMAMVDEVQAEVDESTRHLPGKHDQKSHSGGGGGGVMTSSDGGVAQRPEGGWQNEYEGAHDAPSRDYGAPMHDVESMMPDVLTHPEWYSSGYPEIDADCHRALREASAGGPDTQLWMYRAVPQGAEGGIRPGDWVTPSRKYAKMHGEGALDGKYGVASTRLRAGDLFNAGDLAEWGFDPAEYPADQLRHLPGKHDQKSHAGGGGGGADARLAEVVAGTYEGGATLNPLDGYGAPTTGICVARRHSGTTVEGVTNGRIVPESEFFADGGRKGAEILVDYVDERQDTFFGDGEGGAGEFGPPMVGIWHNTKEGVVALDVTDVVPSSQKDSALRMGREQNQISVFDLDTFEEIPTGGTGRARQAAGGADRRSTEGAVAGDDPRGEGRAHAGRGRLDEAEAGEADRVRHLAGKHDQKTHGKGRVSTGVQAGTKSRVENPVNAPDGTDWNQIPEKTRLKAGAKFEELGLPVTYDADGRPLPDIDAMKANILESYGLASPTDVEYGETFYSSAHNDAKAIADRMGVSEEVGAAAIAAMSPQTAWEGNVVWAHHLAEQVAADPVIDESFLHQKTSRGGEDWTVQSMIANEGYIAKPFGSFESGKRLSEYDIETQAALIGASGKKPMMAVLTAGPNAGAESNQNAMMGNNIERALRIVRGDGSVQSISSELGGHKVRSFYNNILTEAEFDGPVTIDAHAFDIAILGGRSYQGAEHTTDEQKKVLANWGDVKSGVSGIGYAPVAEAYRRATRLANSQRKAEGRDPLTAGEMQAVMWMTTIDGY